MGESGQFEPCQVAAGRAGGEPRENSVAGASDDDGERGGEVCDVSGEGERERQSVGQPGRSVDFGGGRVLAAGGVGGGVCDDEPRRERAERAGDDVRGSRRAERRDAGQRSGRGDGRRGKPLGADRGGEVVLLEVFWGDVYGLGLQVMKSPGGEPGLLVIIWSLVDLRVFRFRRC